MGTDPTPGNPSIERRPDHSGRSAIRAFPKEWGAPPRAGELRKAWIKSSIRAGEEEYRRTGVRPSWLKETR